MTNTKRTREKLEKVGFNRDVELSKQQWDEMLESEHSSSKSLAAIEHRQEPTYRDNRETKSIELKDYRQRKYNAKFVAELEHFNPEKRPLSHIIIDFPMWLWKNRIKNRGPVIK